MISVKLRSGHYVSRLANFGYSEYRVYRFKLTHRLRKHNYRYAQLLREHICEWCHLAQGLLALLVLC